jgi:isopentenyl-diphosphate delta-isomerase
MASEIQRRKDDHVDLCATDAVAFRGRSSLLECVELVHQALPESSLDELDTRVSLLGKTLKLPLVIAAMTGGTDRSQEINRVLAAIAEARGYGFGLGSQRAMQTEPATSGSYQVRQWAPTALVLGNVGLVQARDTESSRLAELAQAIGADALCVHLNPAQELIQPEGDRDFRGGLETFARLVRDLPVPVVGKETGCGLSPEAIARLRQAGVRTVDTSGAGGTSFIGVETLRAAGGDAELGQRLWDWGIPTAASVHFAVRAGMETIATGGIRSGLDVARALVLGARAAGMAQPLLQAYVQGGQAAVESLLDGVERELRAVMLLSGARCAADLGRVPRVITGPLKDWMALGGT